jgi:predicted molibdopterin-dependent oxidoreductase YjgC
MSDVITLRVNGRSLNVGAGVTVAAALVGAGITGFRRSVTGEARGPVCGMGVCFECRVTINGVPHRLGCQTLCVPGMEVQTDAP